MWGVSGEGWSERESTERWNASVFQLSGDEECTELRLVGGSAGQAIKCARWMPRHRPAKKDVASCEKLRGAASELRSGDIRMGKPGGGRTPSSRKGGEPGELKHLSTRRKRNQTRDSLSSGERKGKSPNRGVETPCGVVGPDGTDWKG